VPGRLFMKEADKAAAAIGLVRGGGEIIVPASPLLPPCAKEKERLLQAPRALQESGRGWPKSPIMSGRL